MEKVLTTPELLQSILIQLPVRDLLLIQRVSRTFKSLIESSPAIQRALFFRATPSTSSDPRERNPLLAEVFAPWFKEPKDSFDLTERSRVLSLDWNSNDEKRTAYKRAGASWRRMLVAQPPFKKLDVYKLSHAMMGDHLMVGSSEPQDVTMGLLIDTTIHGLWLGQRSDCFFVRCVTSELKVVNANLILFFHHSISCVMDEYEFSDGLDGLVSEDYTEPKIEMKTHECNDKFEGRRGSVTYGERLLFADCFAGGELVSV